jgi:hypothetical protein
MSNILTILGGINKLAGKHSTIKTVGWFDKTLTPHDHTVCVGEKTKTFIKNRIVSWDSFKNVYYKNGKIDPKYYENFMRVMDKIFILPLYTINDNDMLYMIDKFYNAEPIQIYNGINTTLALLEPFKMTLHHLFMSLKMYLEKLIESFVAARELYIESHNLGNKNKSNEWDTIMDRWISLDIEHSVDTSSPILFFNFPPKTTPLDKSVTKIEWHIIGADNKIINMVDKFLNNVKKREFAYYGFCKRMPITRFKLLMAFPFDTLLKIIFTLNSRNNSSIVKYSNTITKKIILLRDKICAIEKPGTIVLKRKKVPSIEEFPNDIKDKIIFYEKYITAYLDLYNQYIPIFIKKEKLICELSSDVNLVSDNIQQLTKELNKLMNTD